MIVGKMIFIKKNMYLRFIRFSRTLQCFLKRILFFEPLFKKEIPMKSSYMSIVVQTIPKAKKMTAEVKS